MEIKNLEGTDFATIFRGFDRAFADYDTHFGEAQVRSMLRRRGFDPGLSFAAFEGDEIVAFTLNGIGTYGAIPTAYDTGTGTAKEHRGKGLAAEIFRHSIPYLKKAGIEQYLLEVLQHNDKAISVYRKLGFEVTREFDYAIVDKVTVRIEAPVEHSPIRRIDIDRVAANADFCDFVPSWQNSLDSIRRAGDELVCLGAFVEDRLAGYCVFEPAAGDITQIAVDRAYRHRGIASRLLAAMLAAVRNDTVKAINTDTSCRSMTEFLAAKGLAPTGRQFEMIKRL